jgi:hypothetical protein
VAGLKGAVDRCASTRFSENGLVVDRLCPDSWLLDMAASLPRSEGESDMSTRHQIQQFVQYQAATVCMIQAVVGDVGGELPCWEGVLPRPPGHKAPNGLAMANLLPAAFSPSVTTAKAFLSLHIFSCPSRVQLAQIPSFFSLVTVSHTRTLLPSTSVLQHPRRLEPLAQLRSALLRTLR